MIGNRQLPKIVIYLTTVTNPAGKPGPGRQIMPVRVGRPAFHAAYFLAADALRAGIGQKYLCSEEVSVGTDPDEDYPVSGRLTNVAQEGLDNRCEADEKLELTAFLTNIGVNTTGKSVKTNGFMCQKKHEKCLLHLFPVVAAVVFNSCRSYFYGLLYPQETAVPVICLNMARK